MVSTPQAIIDLLLRSSHTDGMRLARATISVLLLWLPFVALWTLFNVIYGQVSLGEAVYGSTLSHDLGRHSRRWRMVISGRYPWPDGLRVSFYIAHLVLGALYAAAWVGRGYVQHAIETGEPLLDEIRQSATFGWQLLMGLWLYGLVAGVSATPVRTRRRLRDKERDAARAEALAVRAQVQALRAQLQPHFLFNALHSVGTALIRHDSAAAEQAVERLGEPVALRPGSGRRRAASPWKTSGRLPSTISPSSACALATGCRFATSSTATRWSAAYRRFPCSPWSRTPSATGSLPGRGRGS